MVEPLLVQQFQLAGQREAYELISRADIGNILANRCIPGIHSMLSIISHIFIPADVVMAFTLLWKFIRKLHDMPQALQSCNIAEFLIRERREQASAH